VINEYAGPVIMFRDAAKGGAPNGARKLCRYQPMDEAPLMALTLPADAKKAATSSPPPQEPGARIVV